MRHRGTISALILGLQACSHTSGSAPNSPLSIQHYAASEKGVHVTSTLVLGEREALLIDAQFIESEAAKVVDMIKRSGRDLTYIYITHGHPDHTFGLPTIHAAFPKARILAHPEVIAEMRATWQAKHDYWKPIFQDDLADTRIDPEPYNAPTLTLEGHELELLGPMAGDSPHTISVYVPEARTLIAGDVSYAGVYPWLADTNQAGWDSWRDTLNELAEIGATTVISGHEAPGHRQTPADLAATAQYISDFQAAAHDSTSAEELVQKMSAKYPDLKLPIVLQVSAGAAIPE